MNWILWTLAVVGAAAVLAGVVVGVVALARVRRKSIVKHAKKETLEALKAGGLINLPYYGGIIPTVSRDDLRSTQHRLAELETKAYRSTKKEKAHV